MSIRKTIPSLSVLCAFDAAARHCNFTRAADELLTSQPTISRHIRFLEAYLGTALFQREGRRVTLTEAGRQFSTAIEKGLDQIQEAIDAIRTNSQRAVISIACTYETAHLWLMPRYEALQAYLGPSTDIRIVSSEYEFQSMVPVNIRIGFSNPVPEEHEARILFYEEVFPVCDPTFPERWDIDRVEDLPLLEMNKRNPGWVTWDTWSKTFWSGRGGRAHRYYGNYVYVLEAAMAGAGMALGWKGFVERHIERGQLIAPYPQRLKTHAAFYVAKVHRGQNSSAVEKAIDFLGRAAPL